MTSGRATAGGAKEAVRIAPRSLALAAGVALLLSLGSHSIRAAGGAPATKAMIRRTAAVEALIAAGRIQVVEEYGGAGRGSTLLVRGSESDLAAAESASGSGRGRRRIPDQILLRSRTIDTSRPRTTLTGPPGRQGRLELIQFGGPVKGRWLSELRARGRARPVAYVPHNAYIVWIEDPAGLSSAQLPLQWREELALSDRISSDLESTQGPIDVTIQVARAGDSERLLAEIRSRALAVKMEARDIGPVTNIRVTLPPGHAEELAARPEVIWVEPFGPVKTHDERSVLVTAGLVAKSRPLDPGYLSWLKGRGLDDLSGIIVDITDTGIDTGGTQVSHPGLRGRVAYAADLTSEGLLEDCAGHGTHIAGIIAGGIGPSADQIDSDGYLLGLGVAPSARVGATRIFNCKGEFVPAVPFTDLVASAYGSGARIGNNSWGGIGSHYNSIAGEYDALVRDANRDPSDGDQPFLPIFSTGNLGPSLLTIGWPATAKNVLSVGATEGFRPVGLDGCGTAAILSDNVDHVLSSGSRGPTSDSRIKPDLVAPGSHIQSLASTSVGFTGVGVCDAYFPPGQRLLNWSTGTSQAAAHASGAAAIAFEVYRRRYGSPPSPAMIKAMMINHAHDMGTTPQTPSNTSSRPNERQGWGRIDTGSMIDTRARVAFDQAHVLSATGEVADFESIVPEDASRPVIVTLVWTDAPGTPGGSAWVNDLDLVVAAEGTVYRGNVIDRGVSVPGGEADFRNNVENVILPPGAGTLHVSVEAANIAGDGVPSVTGETDQDFALYVGNARMASSAGAVDFAQPEAFCGTPLQLRLADLGLRGFGRASIVVESAGDRETVLMDEDPPGTGLFSGGIDVAAGASAAADGVLQTGDGVPVTALYLEPDPDSGIPVQRTATILSRCSPPVITDLKVIRAGDSEATIQWKTSHPADSIVTYGIGATRGLVKSDPKLVTDHEVHLGGLTGCSLYTATVSSNDAAGLASTAPSSPLKFSTGPGTRGRRALFRDGMESLSSRWTHTALPAAGAVDDWELGHPAIGPPGPFSGSRVWGTNLDGNYSLGADAVLISPVLDLRDGVGLQLTFQHYYSIFGGRTPASLNDGGWVEITADGGTTWAALDPLGGYPDQIDQDNPHLPGGSGVYAGTLLGWSKASFDLSSYSGSLAQIRFHIWQDAAENTPTSSGWYIDDVEITAQGTCHRAQLRLDDEELGCSSQVALFLSDSDLNLSPTAIDTARVTAASPTQQIQVTLSETGGNTGEFQAALELAPSPQAGKLAVAQGAAVSFTYVDQDSGGGLPATVTASAMVSDCTPPPPPAGVSVMPDGAGRLRVSWTPVSPSAAPDLQGYRIHYDIDGSGPTYSGTGALQGISPVRVEAASASLALASLAACSAHFISVTAFDRMGNESVFSPEGYAVPNGSLPCSLGRVTVGPAAPGCREAITVTVSDSNADPDAATTGSVTVSATSPSHSGSLASVLMETSPASGVFIGVVALTPSPQAGALVALEGDPVRIDYSDADDGAGQARAASASVTVADCTSPTISDLRVTGRAADRALIRWTTDEPATSTVDYGFDPSLGLTAFDSTLKTAHAVPIFGLSGCSPVHFKVSSTDARSNTSVATDAGSPFRFGTYRESVTFTDDLESGAAGWQHEGFPPGNDEWELGAPVSGVPGGPPAAYSGRSVWGTDLDGPYENEADMVLVSPPIDLGSVEAATLTFKHWYHITSSPGPPDGFDDAAFVEVSTDDGASWVYITPLGGYPDRLPGNPYIPFGSGVYAGSSGGWVAAAFVLDDFVGRIIRIRFHLYEDPLEISLPHAGWYIDDVTVSIALACHDGHIEMDRSEYGCGGAVAVVRVFDLDLDVNPLAADPASARVSSQAEPAGETVSLIETGPSTGLFEASLPIGRADAAGTLKVQEADTIIAVYDDADDGTGAARSVTATARISDCTPPAISRVEVTDVASDSFRVEWITAEPGDSQVLFGTSAALGSSSVLSGLRTSHAVTVNGLQGCTPYFFTVASADAHGNLEREDASAGTRTIHTAGGADLIFEDFENGAPGWRHLGEGDSWEVGPVAGAGMAGNALSGAYARPPNGANSDFVLISPPINLSGVAHPRLTFMHGYDFPTSFQGDDGGWVEGWDGYNWVTLVPDGGYPAFLDPEAGRTGERLPGYAGKSPAGLTPARFNLSGLAARGVRVTRVRFHVFIEGGIGATGAGWRLDDVRVGGDLSCRAGRLVFELETASCASASASLILSDRDLDLSPTAADTAIITIESSGGPAPLQVTLLESGPASGTFRGVVPLNMAGDPGTLRAASGDRLTATYADADDGSGRAIAVISSIPVAGCAGPVISRVSLSPAGDSVIVRWATDRPSTSEVTLAPSTGSPLAASDYRLVTSHVIVLPGVETCASYAAMLASEDSDGVRSSVGGTAGGLRIESSERTIQFFDDMEGPDPGWTTSGLKIEWQRGVPLFGPASAFSGQKVFATDLNGFYDAGTNAALISPPIDLAGAVSPRLTFWHWYDIFADNAPNSVDDSAWVEVQIAGSSTPIYLQPLGGYPDTTDSFNGEPMQEGTAVYAGQSSDWEKATFDLTPFAGKVIFLRFRIWNDFVELLVNGRTGAGWYLDDVEVSSPDFCFEAPAVSAAPLGSLLQGGSATGLTLTGSGFRPGATISFGGGVTVSGVTLVSPSQMAFDLSADPGATLGARDLTLLNPDGQASILPGALQILFNPTRADLDGSGRIDGNDLVGLAESFASLEGEVRYRPAADLNGDGAIDGMDLALLAAQFGAIF